MARKILTVEQGKDHNVWLELRNKGIGGSDAGTIAGLNPWKRPFALWLEKTGQVEVEDISSKEAVYWGTVLEQTVADEFCKITGKKVRKCGTLQDDEYDFILANVDRMVVGENAGLECKTANGFAAKRWEEDEVPDTYYIQCQHYMMVTGCEKWYIACLIGGQHFVWKTIERNEDDIKAIREMEVSFWTNNVLKNIAPDADESKACSEALVKMYPGGDTVELQLDSLKDDAARIQELAGLIKTMTAEQDGLKNKIKQAMGNSEVAYCGEAKVTWRTQNGRVSIDSKKLKAEMPNVFAKYSKQGNAIRVFTVK